MRSRRFLAFICVCAFAYGANSMGQVLSTNTWLPGNGSWTNAAHWSPAGVPNEVFGFNTNYFVRIDGGNALASSVVIDSSLYITLSQLSVSAGDSLTISNGSTLVLHNGLMLTGTVVVACNTANTTFDLYGTQSIDGTGQILFGGTSPSGDNVFASGTLTIGRGISIHGGGEIRGDVNNWLVNLGTITCDLSNQTMVVSQFINQGYITALAGGGLFLYSLTNNGTVTASHGSVHLADNWYNNGVISADVSYVSMDGQFTTAAALGIIHTGGTISVNGTMINSNNTFTLDSTADSWRLLGSIRGGTVASAGGQQLIVPGAFTQAGFDGILLDADVVVSNGASLYVSNGLTNNSTIWVFAFLYFQGAQTLSGTGQVVCLTRLQAQSGTLVIDSGMTVRGNGGSIVGDASNWLVNLGRITSETSNQTTYVQNFINQGRLDALTGGNFNLQNFTNNGTVTVSHGAALQLGGIWGNSGVISGDVSAISIGGTFTTAAALGIIRTGGSTITIAGLMANSNTTLALGPTTGSWYLQGGTIRGGTVTATGGTQLLMPSSSSGTLDAVTLNTDLTVPNGATLYVVNGLTNNATMRLASDGTNTYAYFLGTQSLSGTGQVVFAGTSPGSSYFYALSGTLTNGSGMTIRGNGGYIQGNPPSFGALVNLGTITSETSNQTTFVRGFTNQGRLDALTGGNFDLLNFTNNGTITVSHGGTLQLEGAWGNNGVISGDECAVSLGGTFTSASALTVIHAGGSTVTINGTMINTNNPFVLDPTTGSWRLYYGTIRGGTVTTAGGAQLQIPTFSSGTLDAVTLNSDVTVPNGATLYVVRGLTNNATIWLSGESNTTSLYFGGTFDMSFTNGTQTLGGTGQVVFAGSNPSNDRLYATGGTFTIGSGITIHGNGGAIQGNPMSWYGGWLINMGTITSETSNRTTYVSYAINKGWLNALNGGILSVTTTLTNSGTVEVDNSSTVELSSNYVQTAGNTMLEGGNLTLLNGGSVFIQAGNLSGSGYVGAIVTNSGTIAPGFPTGTLTFTSNLILNASSILSFELGGYAQASQYDFVVVSNAVRFGGALAVSFANNYNFISTMTNGSTFTLLAASPPISGAFTNVSSGGVMATTDGFARFVVTYSGANLVLSSPSIRDDDADGIPNWWTKRYFGHLTGQAGDRSLASDDADGDGLSNLQEYLAGTDPNDSGSAFRITSIVRTANNVRVTWMMGPGKTNALQATSGGGYSTNGFTDIFIITNTVGTVTNYLDVGAATNFPARYYRVRLVP